MYKIEQDALVYIIRQLPKMNISFEKIERDLGFVTAKTLYNYIGGKTKPKGKKFNFLSHALREKYPYEYSCAKAKFEHERGKSLKELIHDEMNEYSVI